MPGIGPLLSLTFAAEVGEVSRCSSAGKLVGYAGLAPRVSQFGERSQTGALSKAGCGSSQERSAPRAPKEK